MYLFHYHYVCVLPEFCFWLSQSPRDLEINRASSRATAATGLQGTVCPWDPHVPHVWGRSFPWLRRRSPTSRVPVRNFSRVVVGANTSSFRRFDPRKGRRPSFFWSNSLIQDDRTPNARVGFHVCRCAHPELGYTIMFAIVEVEVWVNDVCAVVMEALVSTGSVAVAEAPNDWEDWWFAVPTPRPE